ncbi:MAG: tryptophan synthase subunit alpha [Gammaproteobacteria bacterium]|nr:tryptophan synthase subunit alpha [Gammaproteobacteria bacterium]MBT5052584.1 tryptophan synthase subunit alpha [Gammaproteobacteria bacterium]
MGRLTSTINAVQASAQKSLVAYIVAGDPHPDQTVDLMHALVAEGVDIIELGVPFTDPEAEGPVIQLAHERALVHQVTLTTVLAMVSAFRLEDAKTPVVLMGYLNPIEAMGYDVFAEQASLSGVDGLITVNLPPEEAGPLAIALQDKKIDPIYLLAPTTTDARAAAVCRASRGFVYYVSLKGTTGSGGLDIDAVCERVAHLKAQTTLPLFVGFGIKDGATAAPIAAVADGVVVGSAIVTLMGENQASPEALKLEVSELVRDIRTALNASNA